MCEKKGPWITHGHNSEDETDHAVFPSLAGCHGNTKSKNPLTTCYKNIQECKLTKHKFNRLL